MSDSALLRTIDVFSGLADREIEDASGSFAPIYLEKGAHLFYRNDKSTGVYLVAKGSLQVIIDNDAQKEIIVYTVPTGDIIGEMTLFNDAERTATAVALMNCRLFKVKNSRFLELMGKYPVIAVNLARILIDRLHAANAMIERLGTMDGSERIVHFLKALIIREGSDGGEWYHLQNRPTYRQMSQRLGVSEKTIYRTFQSLAAAGDIVLKGRSLSVRRALFDTRDLRL